MQFYIKPEHFAKKRSFTIRDEKKNRLFKVKGKFFWGLRSLEIKDMNSELLYRTKRRFDVTFFKKYTIEDEKNNIVAVINRTRGFKKPKFKIVVFDEQFVIDGDLYGHDFSIRDKENTLIASMGKRVFPSGEAYEIDVQTEKKPLLQLFLIITIDQFLHERRKR